MVPTGKMSDAAPEHEHLADFSNGWIGPREVDKGMGAPRIEYAYVP